jgi:hypothetical protein
MTNLFAVPEAIRGYGNAAATMAGQTLAVGMVSQADTIAAAIPVFGLIGHDFLASFAAAQDQLLDRYGDVDSDLAVALQTLAQPECELAARIFTPAGTRRLCLARRGTRHALAVRTDETVELVTTWADDSGTALA